MALIKLLSGDERPPLGERFLMIAWRPRKGVKVVRHDVATQRKPSFTYQVGPDRWAFWFAEGRLLADRLGLGVVYVKRPPAQFAEDGAAGPGSQMRTGDRGDRR